ncbi:ABC transporter permease [Niallia circulans]|uniref:ABC transporter permease n=1 Tax=Niallia TaxID=2837506 RepID=UPI00077CD455|nr:ABC transporter permease [Niallia circulans]MDR4318172.1 ABC transporter permease [Niallia circulans]MED3837509.1 ABC transporter permease [Niallia circulans]MED4245042.1 ABC transporter permease [Niallia circulans]MED4247768.1 ABC transporter permease [Niallia circulans]QKH60246.1 ABC transporter permease [Niallia circulans]
MTFRQFAFNNVLRNKRLYIAYFLSSMFTVMVFFTFAIFAFHPAFSGPDMNSNALFGMGVAGGIIYIFSFFFVLYSMSSFLQSRKKEFGLLMMLGASNRQIRLLVFLENILIGFFATVSGILAGLVFAKVILLIAENVLIITESLHFYFPTLAIVVTFISFLILFFFISIFVSFILRTNKLIDLIKGDKKSKGEPKASLFLSILAGLLLLVGYVIAISVEGILVVYALVPVVLLVTLGTYLLFTQLSVYFIRKIKRNKSIFWKKTNMLLFSDLSFRMKDNARTFFLVAIISTVAFSAIGTLYGFQSYITKGIKEINRYTFTYSPLEEDSEEVIAKDKSKMNTLIENEKLDVSSEETQLNYYKLAGEKKNVLIARASDYNRFAELIGETKIHPKEDEAIVVEQSDAVLKEGGQKPSKKLLETAIPLKGDRELTPSRVIDASVLTEITAYYVVNDKIYDQLDEPIKSKLSVVWQAKEGQEDKVLAVGEQLDEELSYKAFSVDYAIYQINKAFGPILFIGLFIGIVFFVSAGSFLYFRLFTDLEEEKRKFQSIAKIGLMETELKRVVTRQIALLFFSPIIVALIHGSVALIALSNMFDFNITREAALVLGSFAFIQILYFLIVRYFYVKQVKRIIL